MNLREQVGQLVIMGFDGTAASNALRALVRAIQPGGVILFRRNIEEPRQTWELLRACQELVATPMFLCVDLEGGTVDRLRDAIAPAPSAAHVFATQNRKLFRRHGRLIGKECRALGFNTDFAPVLDLAFAVSQPVMGTRVVSDHPSHVIEYAREFLRGLRDARVLGCGKHFPGLGEGTLDTHHQLAQIGKPWKRLWNEDLRPYRDLRRELPFVMVAHAAYPAVTRKPVPASISERWIDGVLRRKIGYHGLVVSDDLEMGGVLAAAAIQDAGSSTIRAGADLFLVCHNEEHVWRAYEGVLRQAERDRRFARQVGRVVERVLRFKKRARELKPGPAPSEKTVRRLRETMAEFAGQVTESAVVC